MADNQKLPSFILNTKYICTKHNEKLTEFCRDHDLPICIKCRRKFHAKCEDVPKIDDVVQNVKESVLFQDIFVELEAVCENLTEIVDDRVNNKLELEKIRATIEQSLEERIENIIKHLRNIKETTLNNFDSVTSEISETFQIVQCEEQKLRDILDQKLKITRQASNYQTFIAVKRMEKMIQETNMNIQELFGNGRFNQQNVKFDLNETLEDAVYRINAFGEIRVTQTPSAVSIKTTRPADLEAQKEVQTEGPIQLSYIGKIGPPLNSHLYRGCCILPNGFFVFTAADNISEYGQLHIYTQERFYRSIIKFKENEGVFDVTPIDDHYFAVSHPLCNKFSVIDSNTESVLRTFKAGGRVFGLCCKGRDIVCCVVGKGLVTVNIDSGRREIVKVDERVDSDSHVEVSTNVICYTCPASHIVTLMDSKYNTFFNLKDTTVLDYPSSVTIDEHYNIFVTGYKSENVVIISPNGKLHRELLGKNDGLKIPTGVHYDSRTKRLVVLCLNGLAAIYTKEGTFVGNDNAPTHIKGKDGCTIA